MDERVHVVAVLVETAYKMAMAIVETPAAVRKMAAEMEDGPGAGIPHT